MSSCDIFKLNQNNLILHTLSGNVESTTTHNIIWDSIRSISITQGVIIIYHKGGIFKHNIEAEVMIEE